MYKMLEEIRNSFIEENDHYEKVYLPDDEQHRLNVQIAERNYKDGNPFEEYFYEESEEGIYKFYEKKPKDIPEAELNQYISLKMFEVAQAMDKKQNVIKGILVFWLVLGLISLFGTFLALVGR